MPNNAKIQIIGNLTRDPEARQINNNNVVSMPVAVNTNAKNPDGTFKTDFYEVSVWGRLGDGLMQRLQKGSMIWATGSLTTNEYVGRDGKQHLALRVQADDVRGISRLKGDAQQPQQRAAANPPQQPAGYVSMDNEIPF